MLTKFTSLARKLPNPLFKLGAQAYIEKNFPRHIFIETTANCNLSCEYCPREKRKEDMDFELFKSIIDECKKYGPRSFSLHLFGEPLLYPKIIESIAYIKRANKRNTVLLTTNGTILNKFASEILKVKCDRVIWSYRRNNFNGDSIDLLRRIGLIRILIEETPKDEFERWSKFPRVEIKHLHNYGGNINVKKWGLDDAIQSEFYPCYHLWLAPAIRWNGDITICCNDPNGRESVGRYGIDTNIGSYWKSDRLYDIRASHLALKPKGICVGCTSYKAYPDIFFEHQKKQNHV